MAHKKGIVRVENVDVLARALEVGKGVLVLSIFGWPGPCSTRPMNFSAIGGAGGGPGGRPAHEDRPAAGAHARWPRRPAPAPRVASPSMISSWMCLT